MYTDGVVVAGNDDRDVGGLKQESSRNALIKVVLEVQPVEGQRGGLDERGGAEDLGDLPRPGRLLRHRARVLHELRGRLEAGARRAGRRAPTPRGALLSSRLRRL